MIRVPLRLPIAATVLLTAAPATAEVPQVAADIAPVHSLVARVMDGLGEPALIVPQAASPHAYAMRPSEARALASAEAVFWVGPDLTPWLSEPLETLAAGAEAVALIDAPGTERLSFRTDLDLTGGAGEDAHGHDAEDGHASEAHDTTDDHGDHADHDGSEEHGAEGADDHGSHDDGHGHAAGGIDPHAWLSPENGKAWLDAIAATLSDLDPDNAARYDENAAAGKAEIDAAAEEIEAQLAPLAETDFVVFHDAYQYFETRFGLRPAGAIALSDAATPGPARLRALQDKVQEAGIACALAEPQFDRGLIDTVFEGTEARIGVIDPLGAGLPAGPGFYTALLNDVARELATCL